MMNPSLVFPICIERRPVAVTICPKVDITTGGGRIPLVICAKAKR
jgi:hypothetical protein